MREIKFRGMSVNGEWVYGLISKDLPHSTAYYDEYPYRMCWHLEGGGQANCPVQTDTIGQLIGRADKNGVDIYAGDVISDNIGVGSIEYSPRFAAFRVKYRGNRCKWFYDYLDSELRTIEVLGNIYANPELIKE
jgi:hypothetical protein